MPYLWTLDLNIEPAFDEPQKIRVYGGEVESANYMRIARGREVIDEQPRHPLCHTVCNELLTCLAEVKISPVTHDVYGLDGIVYTLRFSAGMSVVQYSWWCDLPEAWSELQPIIDRLLGLAALPVVPPQA